MGEVRAAVYVLSFIQTEVALVLFQRIFRDYVFYS